MTPLEAALTAIEEAGYMIVPNSLSLNKRQILEAMILKEGNSDG